MSNYITKRNNHMRSRYCYLFIFILTKKITTFSILFIMYLINCNKYIFLFKPLFKIFCKCCTRGLPPITMTLYIYKYIEEYIEYIYFIVFIGDIDINIVRVQEKKNEYLNLLFETGFTSYINIYFYSRIKLKGD